MADPVTLTDEALIENFHVGFVWRSKKNAWYVYVSPPGERDGKLVAIIVDQEEDTTMTFFTIPEVRISSWLVGLVNTFMKNKPQHQYYVYYDGQILSRTPTITGEEHEDEDDENSGDGILSVFGEE